jgi:hypothetical protein
MRWANDNGGERNWRRPLAPLCGLRAITRPQMNATRAAGLGELAGTLNTQAWLWISAAAFTPGHGRDFGQTA